MTEPRYQNGKIYKLVSNITDKIYIGSTCVSLAKRLYGHKKKFEQFKNGTRDNCSSSKELFEIDPNIKIILIEDFPCRSKNELERRERFHIETNVCVNKTIPTRTNKEYYEQNRDKISEKRKEYREQNKDKISEKDREKYEQNKDEVLARNREYYQQHKGEVLAHIKEYQKANRDKILTRKRQYREQHKGEINARQREYLQQHKDEINTRRRERRRLAKEKAENDSAIATDTESDEILIIYV